MPRALFEKAVWFGSFLLAFALWGGVAVANAQSIYISPATGSYSVGQSFSVRVMIKSPTRAVNAVSGTLTFPHNLLQVLSVSKNDSAMSLWVQDPSFDNNAGTVDFAGVVLNPGFTGSGGNVLTINFKPVNSGTANLGFSTGSLLANDGAGTNILDSLGSAVLTLGFAGAAPAPVATGGSLTAPIVSSDTHPDPKKWYTSDSPHFLFQSPSNATSISILLDKSPNSTPSKSYAPPITDKSIQGLAEGVWYMHAEYITSSGSSAITDFRVNIDHSPPTGFAIQDSSSRDRAIGAVQISITATDAVSYIDHYDLSIDGAPAVTWRDDGSGVYTTPELFAGSHTIQGKVFDAAGNSALASLDFSIDGLAAPSISDYTKQITSSEPIMVKGTTLPGMTARLFVDTEKGPVKVADAKAGSDGSFDIEWQPDSSDLASGVLSPLGLHNMFVVGRFDDGRITKNSDKMSLVVGTSVTTWLSQTVINFLVVLIIIIALIYLTLHLFMNTRKKFREYRKDVRLEAKQAESVLHQAFKGMRDNLQSYVDKLEDVSTERRLTDAEKILVRSMRQNLDDAEKIIGKEITDVEEKADRKIG